jgi:hypothetical protein
MIITCLFCNYTKVTKYFLLNANLNILEYIISYSIIEGFLDVLVWWA